MGKRKNAICLSLYDYYAFGVVDFLKELIALLCFGSVPEQNGE